MTNQKESIILKGIAQNLLQMNVPKLSHLNEMLSEFNLECVQQDVLMSLIENDIKNTNKKEVEITSEASN